MTDVEKLKGIIEEIDYLIEIHVIPSNREFKEWRSRAKMFLYHKYGENSIEYKDFSKYTFLPEPPINKKLAEFIVHEKCISDLLIVKGLFNDYLLDLQDEEAKLPLKSENEQCLERIFTRFRKVAVQLTRRHSNRETLIIKDEYDVQDLLHGLLKLYFDDVRPEEWTPSYAGGAVRTDFLIPEIKTIIEVKKTRDSMNDKTVGEELIIDIEKYQSHPDCDKIYCFVYDPDTILRNPAAIKKDLEEKHQGLVRVYIES